MSNFNSRKLEGNVSWMRLLPYVACGIVVFSLTSTTELNYVLKSYLVLLEAQAAIALIYFLTRMVRSNQRQDR